MDRRDFLKVICAGAATFFLNGCGFAAVDEKNNSDAKAQAKNISEGDAMKIVVINSSPHAENESTSRYLAQKFSEGAKSKGHEIFTFDAANEETNPCQGCDHCGMDGPCIFNDAIETKLMPEMLKADVLVLVTPLYYYGMSAQLKTVIDRFYSRTGRLNGKKSILLTTAWNTADWTFTALKTHYETLVRYMNWTDMGQVLATGCGYRSAVENSQFGDVAFNIGASL
ncbi:MAG: flavodoxin family protein [Selenomonadaceae bacterium]|nr:flavodoxin family protein [Selenomonadaceae bacterium]